MRRWPLAFLNMTLLPLEDFGGRDDLNAVREREVGQVDREEELASIIRMYSRQDLRLEDQDGDFVILRIGEEAAITSEDVIIAHKVVMERAVELVVAGLISFTIITECTISASSMPIVQK